MNVSERLEQLNEEYKKLNDELREQGDTIRFGDDRLARMASIIVMRDLLHSPLGSFLYGEADGNKGGDDK